MWVHGIFLAFLLLTNFLSQHAFGFLIKLKFLLTFVFQLGDGAEQYAVLKMGGISRKTAGNFVGLYIIHTELQVASGKNIGLNMAVISKKYGVSIG